MDRKRALRDPGSIFSVPEEVRDHSGLDPGEKLEILRRWAYDARELEVAEDEGMIGGELDLLGRIGAVLVEMGQAEKEASLRDPL